MVHSSKTSVALADFGNDEELMSLAHVPICFSKRLKKMWCSLAYNRFVEQGATSLCKGTKDIINYARLGMVT